MSKYGLTAEELLVVKLVFLAQENHAEHLKMFKEDCSNSGLLTILQNLQEKEVILKSYKLPAVNSKFYPENVEFNKIFMKNYLQHSYDMGMELFLAYPSFVSIQGKQCSLKNLSKMFHSIDDFAYNYAKNIKFNLEKHKEVLEILEWAKENNLLHYGISEFITSLKWLELAELMESGDINGYSNSELL